MLKSNNEKSLVTRNVRQAVFILIETNMQNNEEVFVKGIRLHSRHHKSENSSIVHGWPTISIH